MPVALFLPPALNQESNSVNPWQRYPPDGIGLTRDSDTALPDPISMNGTVMKTIAILIAEGFEEAEAIIVTDFFRRVDQSVELLACGQESLEVLSYHEIPVRADSKLSYRKEKLYDAIMLPGGPEGARRLGRDAMTIEFIKRHLASGKLVCPFCSAGAHVMAANNLLAGCRYTCSGDNHTLYQDGTYVDEKIVRSGNILTGKGLGVAFEFSGAIAHELGLGDIADMQLEHIYFDKR